MAERIAKEVRAVDTALDRLGLVLRHHHRQHDRDVRVHGEAGGHAFGGSEQLVVLADPFGRIAGLDERERQGADPIAGGEVDRLAPAAGDPHRRMGLLRRLRDHVARWHLYELTVHARERLLDQHPGDRVDLLLPHLALALAVDQEATQLGAGARLAGPEVDATLGDQVERGDPFGDARRVIDGRHHVDDPVAEPDATRPLGGGGQEHLGGRGVRVLLQKVMLDLPHVVEPEPVGELDLLERVEQELRLAGVGPRPGELVLVEDSEPHGRSMSWR